ncbi:MAG TPA: capsule assembly Wzi family protein, partial [Cyclobacteriaceae bacterium]|nr:capsule assembly Wzi family protein [Cyclobacteriaceae bacterium]
MILRFAVVIHVIAGLHLTLSAQPDSVRHEISMFSAFSNTNYLPHYLIYNQQARFEDKSFNIQYGYASTVQHKFNKWLSAEAGAQLQLRNENEFLLVQQLYGRVNIGYLSLIGGRFFNQPDIPSHQISSGDLMMSQNALPIPRIGLMIEDFQQVPYTQGWLQFKGKFFHGWFENDRFIASPWLHEKSIYLRAGKEEYRVTAQAGFAHFVQWGGIHPVDGNLYESFEDYINIIFGRSARPDAGVDFGEILNALGNHIGYWDANITYHFDKSRLSLYYQHPYETKMSINPFRNRDLMAGLNFTIKNKNSIINAVSYEFLSTMQQRGPGVPDPMPWVPEDNFGYPYGGRNDLYNNYYYTNGWTYRGFVIGNPLLTTYQRLTNIGIDINRHNVEIVNNRVIANHLGISGQVGKFNYRMLNTLSRNFGTYAGIYDGRFSW